jgi:hypothetical protein
MAAVKSILRDLMKIFSSSSLSLSGIPERWRIENFYFIFSFLPSHWNFRFIDNGTMSLSLYIYILISQLEKGGIRNEDHIGILYL